MINGHTVPVPRGENSAAIDSGGEAILGPRVQVASIYAHIPGAKKQQVNDVEGNGDEFDVYTVPCDTLAHVSFSFNGKQWSLPAAVFAGQVIGKGKNDNARCQSAIYGSELGTVDASSARWVIGKHFSVCVFAPSLLTP